MTEDVVRLAALADIHYTKSSQGSFQPLFEQIAETAEVVLCGSHRPGWRKPDPGEGSGARESPSSRRSEITTSSRRRSATCALTDVASTRRLRLLEFRVGFAGVRGFCGGFGRGARTMGEKIVKDFVHEALQEALAESALARLVDHRIVLMHYAPIRETVEEPLEITCSSAQLPEDPPSRFDVPRCFTAMPTRAPEGRRRPHVYNVALGAQGTTAAALQAVRGTRRRRTTRP
jgi:hypothetical protein